MPAPPANPADNLDAASSAEYEELVRKSNELWAKADIIAQYISQLGQIIAETNAYWQGNRAEKFRRQWDQHQLRNLKRWEGELRAESERLMREANKIG